jgi:hypothetical protein
VPRLSKSGRSVTDGKFLKRPASSLYSRRKIRQSIMRRAARRFDEARFASWIRGGMSNCEICSRRFLFRVWIFLALVRWRRLFTFCGKLFRVTASSKRVEKFRRRDMRAFCELRTILAAVPAACGGKRLQRRGEVWRLSQRPLVDESSP